MFEKFSDYMYSLLFTPLKKVRQAVNQFYLFFKVVGNLFDDTKADIFRVREESMIASASEIMLPEHGKDRDMPRLKGETTEGYRTRLSMKAIISEKAGTLEAIYLVMDSLQLKNAEVHPLYATDINRWAEFVICLSYGFDDTLFNIKVLRLEIRKIKPASAKDNYSIRLLGSISMCEEVCLNRVTFFLKMQWYKNALWDGNIQWSGIRQWDNYQGNHPLRIVIKMQQQSRIAHAAGLTQKYHYRTWDGTSRWDGTKMWDAQIIKEVI